MLRLIMTALLSALLMATTASLIVALLWWRGTQETAGRVFGD